MLKTKRSLSKISSRLPAYLYIAYTNVCVLLCFIDPRVRKIRNEASSCPGIFSRTLRLYYVASSPGSPLPHLLDGHRKLVGRSAIPAVLCTHIQIHMCRDLVHLPVDSSGPPGVSSRPLGSHHIPHVWCVCVSAYSHTYTHSGIHSHPRQL